MIPMHSLLVLALLATCRLADAAAPGYVVYIEGNYRDNIHPSENTDMEVHYAIARERIMATLDHLAFEMPKDGGTSPHIRVVNRTWNNPDGQGYRDDAIAMLDGSGWLLNAAVETPAPIYLILVGPATTRGKFLVHGPGGEEETIDAAALRAALAKLMDGLKAAGQAQTEVVLIVDCPYAEAVFAPHSYDFSSSTFARLTVFLAARRHQLAHQGPIEDPAAPRQEGAFFACELFRLLSQTGRYDDNTGYDLTTAFQHARRRVHALTRGIHPVTGAMAPAQQPLEFHGIDTETVDGRVELLTVGEPAVQPFRHEIRGRSARVIDDKPELDILVPKNAAEQPGGSINRLVTLIKDRGAEQLPAEGVFHRTVPTAGSIVLERESLIPDQNRFDTYRISSKHYNGFTGFTEEAAYQLVSIGYRLDDGLLVPNTTLTSWPVVRTAGVADTLVTPLLEPDDGAPVAVDLPIRFRWDADKVHEQHASKNLYFVWELYEADGRGDLVPVITHEVADGRGVLVLEREAIAFLDVPGVAWWRVRAMDESGRTWPEDTATTANCRKLTLERAKDLQMSAQALTNGPAPTATTTATATLYGAVYDAADSSLITSLGTDDLSFSSSYTPSVGGGYYSNLVAAGTHWIDAHPGGFIRQRVEPITVAAYSVRETLFYLDAQPAISGLSPTSITCAEGATATLTVTIDRAVASAVDVTLTSADPAVAAVPTTVSIAPYQKSATFSVTGTADDLVDGTASTTITATYNGQRTATVSVTDADAATIALAATSASVAEGDSGTITAVLSSGDATLAAPVTIAVDRDGGSTGGDEVTLATADLSFATGAGDGASASTTITSAEDTHVEADETAIYTLGTINGLATLSGASTYTLTITDDDQATVSFATTSSSIDERASTADVAVDLALPASGTLQRDVAVDVVTVDDSASAGQDYAPVSDTIAITAGTAAGTVHTVHVDIVDDHSDEADEHLELRLQSPSAGLVGGDIVHTLTITDNDDRRVTVTVSPLAALPAGLQVEYRDHLDVPVRSTTVDSSGTAIIDQVAEDADGSFVFTVASGG